MKTLLRSVAAAACMTVIAGANVRLLRTNVLSAANETAETMWKRVARFDPGTRVKIAVDGGAPAER